jgi:hypothetical protein
MSHKMVEVVLACEGEIYKGGSGPNSMKSLYKGGKPYHLYNIT